MRGQPTEQLCWPTTETAPEVASGAALSFRFGRTYFPLAVAAGEAMTVDIARGTLTKPERLGHREYFVMYKHQDTPPLDVGCRA